MVHTVTHCGESSGYLFHRLPSACRRPVELVELERGKPLADGGGTHRLPHHRLHWSSRPLHRRQEDLEDLPSASERVSQMRRKGWPVAKPVKGKGKTKDTPAAAGKTGIVLQQQMQIPQTVTARISRSRQG